MRGLLLVAMVGGCGSAALRANDPPACAFDLVAPGAHGSTCNAVDSPYFDVALDVAGVGHIATRFAQHDYVATSGEAVDLAIWSIVELDDTPCTIGNFDIDALPPHWVVSLDVQCGPKGVRGVAYGDLPGNEGSGTSR